MVYSNEIKELKERWSSEKVQHVNEVLKRGGDIRAHLSDVPITDEGLLDLRGIKIAVSLKRKSLHKIDLSFSQLVQNGQFNFCDIKDCRFVEARVDTNLGHNLTACVFSKALMQGVHLRGYFESCDFSQAKVSNAVSIEGEFVDCNFNESDLRDVRLKSCTFDECTFTDSYLENATFYDSQLIDTNLQDQDLESVFLEKTSFK